MRSAGTRWIVALAVGIGLIGVVLKAGDYFGGAPETSSTTAKHAAPGTPEDARTAPGTPAPVAAAARAPRNDVGGSPAAAPTPEVAEPLDSVHALVGEPAARGRLGEAAAKNRRSAVAAGPRARRRATALAAVESEGATPRPGHGPSGNGPSGTGAVLPGANPGERAAAPPPPPEASGIVFDSGDASYPTDGQVAVANLKGVGAGTVSFWLQPQWSEGNQDDAAFIELGDSLRIMKNVSFMRFEALSDGVVTSGVGAPITDWKDGEWHQVTATWQGDQMTLYFDGNLVSRAQRVAPITFMDDAQMFVGSSYPEGRPVAPGVMGQIGLENHPLTPSEVQARFLKTIGR